MRARGGGGRHSSPRRRLGWGPELEAICSIKAGEHRVQQVPSMTWLLVEVSCGGDGVCFLGGAVCVFAVGPKTEKRGCSPQGVVFFSRRTA